MTKELGLYSCHRHEIFSFSEVFRLAVGPTQLSVQLVLGAVLEAKQPGHEVDHSSPSSAEVKNAWSYISTSLYAFMRWCLINHRVNFTFALLIVYPTVRMILLYVDRWTDSCMMKVIGTCLCFVVNVLKTGCTTCVKGACAVLW
jgi:hypothetical protein